MKLSRRRFLRSTLILAGISALPPIILSSCLPAKGKRELRTVFIGSRENFERYLPFFRKLKRNKFTVSSLEDTLAGDADISFCDTGSTNKSTYILLLLEQGKDVLVNYPMGHTLGEYAAVSDFMVKHGRIVGMLNPLLFYPSVQLLKESIALKNVSIREIRISCHPDDLGEGFLVPGLCGSAQPLQRVVSYISGSFPLQVLAKATGHGNG